MTDRIGNWLLQRMTPHDALTLVYVIIGICVVMCGIAVIRGGYGLAQLGSLGRRKVRKPVDERAELLALAARETGNPYQSPEH